MLSTIRPCLGGQTVALSPRGPPWRGDRSAFPASPWDRRGIRLRQDPIGDLRGQASSVPKIDQPMRFAKISSAMRPRCELPIGVEAGRPDGDGRLARRDRQNAAADAALARQADAIGEFSGAVVMAAGQHQRVDAPRPLGRHDGQAAVAGCVRRGRESAPPSPAGGRTWRSRNDGSRRRACNRRDCRARRMTSCNWRARRCESRFAARRPPPPCRCRSSDRRREIAETAGFRRAPRAAGGRTGSRRSPRSRRR